MDNTCLNIAVLIANSIAALAAVVAVVIAIVVYVKSAKLQKKAINYSLLDSRLQLWKYFEHDRSKTTAILTKIVDGRDWQVEKFKLLFGEKLYAEFCWIEEEKKNLNEEENEIYALERDAFPVHVVSDQITDKSNYDNCTKIKNARKKVLDNQATDEDWLSFQALCDELFKDNQYYTKVKNIEKRRKELTARDKAFIQRIENEISSSIQDKKKSKRN